MVASQNLDDNYGGAYIDNHHLTRVFPWSETGACNLTMTFTSHASNNTWSNWAVIVDSAGTKLSDSTRHCDIYLAAVIAEAVSKKDNIYQVEISYGDTKSVVNRFRALAGDTKISSDSGKNLRNLKIPAGEEIYYRCASTVGAQNILGQIRFYCEDGQ